MYVEVAVNLPVDDTFHYEVPAEYAGKLRVGQLVEVSFGRQLAQGIILGFEQFSEYASVAKHIRRLLDRDPIVTEAQIDLAHWMGETYLTPLSACIRLFIPPGLSKRGDIEVIPLIDPALIEPMSRTQASLLSLLKKRGPLRGRQIARALPRKDWRSAAAQLAERGLLLREPRLDPPSVRPKTSNVVELAVAPEDVEAIAATHYDPAVYPANRQAAAARRAAILRLLARERRPLQVSEVYAEVADANIQDLRYLAEDDRIILREQVVLRDPLSDRTFVPKTLPDLTSDQARVWSHIVEALDADEAPQPVLLHGVTGSGKTEIYLRAVKRMLSQGRSAIILVPEIALTAQTVQRFGAHFAEQLGLIHSSLSPGERYDTWRRARDGQIRVVVGPRSALFTPVQDLGLIVIDEAHDDSYKQSPPIDPPYYHTVDTATVYGRLVNALVLMGTATPNVTQYWEAKRGTYTLHELPARIMGHREAIRRQAARVSVEDPEYTSLPADEPAEAVTIGLPPVEVVDMRHELRTGNRSIFSRVLQEELQQVLARGEQAILFLNRRGSATHVVCRDCGHVLVCPGTTIPMTYHTTGPHAGRVVCHISGYSEPHPTECPNCDSPRIKYFGSGTQKLEAEVLAHFPQAVPVRWDADTTAQKGSHNELLRRFADGEANVLVGTQMVAKGLDMPLVTLVGVISADTALYLPDFRASEWTFQLLTQVAGRAGRGVLGGRVVVQTYAPEHYAIRAAAEHDFHGFYAEENEKRAEIGYPPYSRLVRLLIRGYDLERVKEEAGAIYDALERAIEGGDRTSLIGPVPCFYDRIDRINRWQVIVRSPDPVPLVARTIEPAKFLQIDVDPVSLL
ncbi:MAG: primosomal protein N' [Anaerolineae bacterium]